MKVDVSVIIPVQKINDRLRLETIPAILKQSYQSFEIIILPDKKSKEKFANSRVKLIATWPKIGPADKRDIGAKKAKGEMLAFLDDDSYPCKNWLKEAVKLFQVEKQAAAICGPTLTPTQGNLRQRVAGYVWGSSLGSRGAGFYRYTVARRREVDDFPSANLLVRKKDFWQAGGFNTSFWSGEDTKLCLNLTKKLGKKILYDPKILVYHHRRDLFKPHLEQIARYGLHRGYFARTLPQTSLRLGYLAPPIFVLGVLFGPLLAKFFNQLWYFYWFVILFYLLLLGGTGMRIFKKEKSLKISTVVILAIFLTHFVYGILFVRGFLTPKLNQ